MYNHRGGAYDGHPCLPLAMPRSPAPPLSRVLESALYVDDLARSRAFYGDTLGLTVLLDTPRIVALDVGGASILLLFQRGATGEPLPTAGGVVPPHGGSGEQHLAFAVSAESLAGWRAHLADAGIPIESEVTWSRGGTSIYVRDPDGHSVEFAAPGVWATY
jgi:catechol 2,3-dioxygenase-like lactoylglutathione lyase family enzyme